MPNHTKQRILDVALFSFRKPKKEIREQTRSIKRNSTLSGNPIPCYSTFKVISKYTYRIFDREEYGISALRKKERKEAQGSFSFGVLIV